MNFKDKELIIFDLDGTLIDSIPDLGQAVNMMLAHYNIKPVTIKEITPFVGNGAKALVKRSLDHTMKSDEISDKLLEEALKIYFSSYAKVVCDKTYAYPGVVETLAFLNNKTYKMVICTNKPLDFIEPILDKLRIKNYFKTWIGEGSVNNKKPNPEPLLYLSDKMSVPINKCVMIGDSKNDILAAKNAKMDSIGVSYGYNYNQDIADFSPTYVVDQFSQLQELF